MVRQMARDGEALVAEALRAHGKKKRSRRRSRSDEVEKVLAEILASGQPVPNPFETIAQIMGQAVRTAKPDSATAKPAGELPDAPPF
jgi:hypothetical protein